MKLTNKPFLLLGLAFLLFLSSSATGICAVLCSSNYCPACPPSIIKPIKSEKVCACCNSTCKRSAKTRVQHAPAKQSLQNLNSNDLSQNSLRTCCTKKSISEFQNLAPKINHTFVGIGLAIAPCGQVKVDALGQVWTPRLSIQLANNSPPPQVSHSRPFRRGPPERV